MPLPCAGILSVLLDAVPMEGSVGLWSLVFLGSLSCTDHCSPASLVMAPSDPIDVLAGIL